MSIVDFKYFSQFKYVAYNKNILYYKTRKRKNTNKFFVIK